MNTCSIRHRLSSTIVDAGANVGFASIYFANRWPNARIVAIEPDPANFEVLVENGKQYQNLTPVQAAVWKVNAKLDLFDPGKGAWGLQTKVSADGRVYGLTLPEIMRRYDMPQIDVLKMDIEGAEREVFEGCADWIDCIGSLIVEIHDHSNPGAYASVMRARINTKRYTITELIPGNACERRRRVRYCRAPAGGGYWAENAKARAARREIRLISCDLSSHLTRISHSPVWNRPIEVGRRLGWALLELWRAWLVAALAGWNLVLV